MKASLLTIGDELLSGKTTNTNATWISRNLTLAGCNVVRNVTVRDKEEEILDSLSALFELSVDLVLCTGGLGPTHDDITRNTIFQFFNSDSILDEDYWKNLQKRFSSLGYSIPPSNKSQAIIPHNGKVFPNPIGSARGLVFHKDDITLMAMPGVPSEMKAMMSETVIPWVRKKSKKKNFCINIRTTGIPESVLYEKIKVKNSIQKSINLGYYPSLFGVDIRISGNNISSIEKVQKLIVKDAGPYIYNIGEESLENIIVNQLMKNNLTIATAESCTGGLIGHRITQVSGSSKVYNGGLIAYSNKAKLNQLKINSATLNRFGAVSKEVASEMAVQVRNIFDSDIGVSVTGIAGPGGGTKDKPVGLVYVGYSDCNGLITKQFNFHSSRESNKIRTSQAVLNLIKQKAL